MFPSHAFALFDVYTRRTRKKDPVPLAAAADSLAETALHVRSVQASENFSFGCKRCPNRDPAESTGSRLRTSALKPRNGKRTVLPTTRREKYPQSFLFQSGVQNPSSSCFFHFCFPVRLSREFHHPNRMYARNNSMCFCTRRVVRSQTQIEPNCFAEFISNAR